MSKSPSESLYWVLWNKTSITHHMSKGTVEDWTFFGENRWSSSWSQVACLWVPDPSCCETLCPLPGFSLVNKFLLPKRGRTLGWELENPDSMCCYSIDFLSLGFPSFKMELAGKVKPKYETIFTMIKLNLLWINKVCCWFSVAGLHICLLFLWLLPKCRSQGMTHCSLGELWVKPGAGDMERWWICWKHKGKRKM